MKKKNYIFIILTVLLLISSIYFNINTINKAEQRIITEKENTPITELLTKTEEQSVEEIAEEEKDTMVVKETNSYTSSELAVVITMPLVTSLSIVLLFSTSFGKLSIKETINNKTRLAYSILSLIILSTALPTTNVIISDNKILNGETTLARNEKMIAIVEVTQDKKTDNLKEESKDNNTSVLQISNQSTYTGTNLELNKSDGLTTDKEISEYFGLNSAVIVKDASILELTDSSIRTNADYSSAIFLSGLSSKAVLNNVTLKTLKNNSPSISISEEAELNASNLEISTIGNNSSAIKTLDTNSTVYVSDSMINTEGTNSPLFYSNGKIEVTKITGTSSNSPIGIINNVNSIEIKDSELTTSTSNEKDIYNAAFTIYKKATYGSSNNYNYADLTIENTKITIDKKSSNYKTASIFYIKNMKTKINITDTKLKYGSNTLLNVVSEDEYNISEVTMTVTDQNLKGNIVVDEYSKVRLNLNDCIYTGRINKGNVSKNVDVTFDEDSRWVLTGNSYVNTLTVTKKDLNNIRKYIRSNGYNIYYNAKNNEWLNGRTIYLNGGGKLIPKYYKS